MNDRRGNPNRKPVGCFSDLGRQVAVGLVIDQEHGRFGDFGRPPVDLDAVELIDRQELVKGHVQRASPGPRAFAPFHDNVGFNFPQLRISNIEEVPGPTSRVNVDISGEFFLEASQVGNGGGFVGDEPVCSVSVFIEKQRANGFQDVSF